LVCLPAGITGVFVLSQSADRSAEVLEDPVAPVSTLASPTFYLVPPLASDAGITLLWTGADNPDGSGIACYDVQYRWDPLGNDPRAMYVMGWCDLLTGTTSNSTTLSVEPERAYYFRVRATDNFGNVEQWPEAYDSLTVVAEMPEDVHETMKALIDAIGAGAAGLPGGHCGGLEDYMAYHYLHDTSSPASSVLPLPPVYLQMQDRYYVQGQPTVQIYPCPQQRALGFWEDHGIIRGYNDGPITVKWNGTDGKGTGIAAYDVQYEHAYKNMYCCNGPMPGSDVRSTGWILWQNATSENSGEFCFSGPGEYGFRCRATDNSGNVEPYPATPDAKTVYLDPYLVYAL